MRYSNEKRYNLFGLALSLTLLCHGSMAFASGAQELEKVDFVSLNGATEINLYTNEGVKHKAVLVSDDKLVIDLKGVNVTQTVRTNFSHARNVDNIVFQPLSEDKLRLIIRGERLGQPLIAYKSRVKPNKSIQPLALDSSALSASDDGKLLIEDFDGENGTDTGRIEAVHDDGSLDTGGIVPAILTPEINKEEPSNSDSAILDPDISGAAANIELSDVNPMADELVKPLNLQNRLKATPAQAISQSFTDMLGWSTLGLPNFPIPLPQAGVILALLVGLGLFLKKKLTALRQTSPVQGLGNASPSTKKRLNFRELANQQNSPSESEQQQQQSEEIFAPTNHPKKANKWASNPNQTPPKRTAKNTQNAIGLSALFDTVNPLSGKQPPASSNKKQALNQYQKQAVTPSANQPTKKRPMAKKPTTPSAAKQTPKNTGSRQKARDNHPLNPITSGTTPKAPSIPNAARQAMINKALKQPQPNQNEPIPENTKVLDFLKNVAEMMEQDGKHDKAQQINKGIRRGFNQ